MKESKTYQVLQRIHSVQTLENKKNLLDKLSETNCVLSFVNLHAVYLCLTNVSFYEAIISSDVIVRDGVGVSVLMRLLRLKPGYNMVGTDFIPEIIDYSKKSKIVLIGTDFQTVKIACDKLNELGFNVIDQCDGFQTEEFYGEFVKNQQPDILVLGMGMPKQELVSYYLRKTIQNKCLIINGGAIIDYIGMKVDRAPKWVRKLRMEWFFRFLVEPKRLFKRYFIEPFLIAILIIKDLTIGIKP